MAKTTDQGTEAQWAQALGTATTQVLDALHVPPPPAKGAAPVLMTVQQIIATNHVLWRANMSGFVPGTLDGISTLAGDFQPVIDGVQQIHRPPEQSHVRSALTNHRDATERCAAAETEVARQQEALERATEQQNERERALQLLQQEAAQQQETLGQARAQQGNADRALQAAQEAAAQAAAPVGNSPVPAPAATAVPDISTLEASAREAAAGVARIESTLEGIGAQIAEAQGPLETIRGQVVAARTAHGEAQERVTEATRQQAAAVADMRAHLGAAYLDRQPPTEPTAVVTQAEELHAAMAGGHLFPILAATEAQALATAVNGALERIRNAVTTSLQHHLTTAVESLVAVGSALDLTYPTQASAALAAVRQIQAAAQAPGATTSSLLDAVRSLAGGFRSLAGGLQRSSYSSEVQAATIALLTTLEAIPPALDSRVSPLAVRTLTQGPPPAKGQPPLGGIGDRVADDLATSLQNQATAAGRYIVQGGITSGALITVATADAQATALEALAAAAALPPREPWESGVVTAEVRQQVSRQAVAHGQLPGRQLGVRLASAAIEEAVSSTTVLNLIATAADVIFRDPAAGDPLRRTKIRRAIQTAAQKAATATRQWRPGMQNPEDTGRLGAARRMWRRQRTRISLTQAWRAVASQNLDPATRQALADLQRAVQVTARAATQLRAVAALDKVVAPQANQGLLKAARTLVVEQLALEQDSPERALRQLAEALARVAPPQPTPPNSANALGGTARAPATGG